MPVVILSFILCLGATCELIKPVEWPRDATMTQCMVQAQIFITEWMRQHPSYEDHELVQWSCDIGPEGQGA